MPIEDKVSHLNLEDFLNFLGAWLGSHMFPGVLKVVNDARAFTFSNLLLLPTEQQRISIFYSKNGKKRAEVRVRIKRDGDQIEGTFILAIERPRWIAVGEKRVQTTTRGFEGVLASFKVMSLEEGVSAKLYRLSTSIDGEHFPFNKMIRKFCKETGCTDGSNIFLHFFVNPDPKPGRAKMAIDIL